MGLRLIQGQLELPALGGEAGQLFKSRLVGVKERRDMPGALVLVCEGGVIELVGDHAHLQSAIAPASVTVDSDVGQIGTVLKRPLAWQ